MSTTFWVFIVLLILGAVALASYLVRLQRQSRDIERKLDYSKMREWRDED